MPELPTIEHESSIDLMQIAGRLWRRKLWIAISVAVTLLLSGVVIRLIIPAYTIELKVTPAAPSGDISGKMGQLSGLAAVAGISLDKSSSASSFDLYLEMLRSRELAQMLTSDPRIMHTIFVREWDRQSSQWHKPGGLASALNETARQIFGAPAQPWRAPDATRLQRYLAEHVIIARGTKDPITRIIFQHPDPEFGRYLLARMNSVTDSIVRKQALDRAESYVQYLTVKLPSVLVVEQRQALTSILSDQEKSIMMASTPLPFAVISVDTINASDHPTNPDGLLIAGAAIALGFSVGIVIALIDWSRLRRAVRHRDGADS